MSTFNYAQIVQICNYLMVSNATFEARPAADLLLPNVWSVMVRASHLAPWMAYDLSGINMTNVVNYLEINRSMGGFRFYGADNPVGLSPDELALITRYLTVVGGFKFARVDGDRILTSPDGQQWTVFQTSTEFNFPAAQAAVVALLGHP